MKMAGYSLMDRYTAFPEIDDDPIELVNIIVSASEYVMSVQCKNANTN